MSRADAAELFDGFDRFAITLTSDEDCDLLATKTQWLSVAIDVRSGSRVWSEEDSCLTRAEADQLARWMEALATRVDTSECSFREGNLRFERDGAQIIVHCDLEFAPPHWDDPERGFRLALPFDAAQASAFAAAVRAQLAAIDRGEDHAPSPLLPPPRPRR